MADNKPKKRKEKSLLDMVSDKYNQAAKSGYLGAKAQVAAKKRKKSGSK